MSLKTEDHLPHLWVVMGQTPYSKGTWEIIIRTVVLICGICLLVRLFVYFYFYLFFSEVVLLFGYIKPL